MNKLKLPVMVFLLYLCVVDQMLVVAETSAPMHKLTFLTNALPFVCEKGEKNQGEQCNWNSVCFLVPRDICISPEGPPAELILFLGPLSLLCPPSPFEKEGV